MEDLNSSPVLPLANLAVTTVQPLKKTDHVETIDPTILDLPFKDCFAPTFFAYRLADKSDDAYKQLVKRIKESLQKVLISFFSYAGRWIAVPNTTRRKLLCNDTGVPFVEAYVDRELDSVVQASGAFQPIPELQGYDFVGLDKTQFKQQIPPDGEGLPSIFVQMTRFKCGGVVLAVTFNHTLTDAKGLFHFMTAWSDLSRTDQTAVRVDHDRAQVELPSIRELFFKEDIAEVPNTIKEKLWAMKCFEVSESVIKSLKKAAKDDKLGPGYVSTFDCVLANLWKGLAGLPSSLRGDKEVAIGFPIEGRTKFFDRPLPDLCGNPLVLGIAPKTPANELLQMPLVAIAGKLRASLLKRAEERKWLESKTFQNVMTFTSGEYATFSMTSSFKFPVYEIDFGLGKPYFAIVGNTFYSQVGNTLGRASLHPPLPNSSSSAATLYVWSPLDVLQALLRDPDFLSLFLENHNANWTTRPYS